MQCRCGNAGCWETKAGENHLLVTAGRLPGGGPEGVAEVIVGVLTDDAPPARVQTSELAARFAGVKLSDLDGAHVQHVTAGWVRQAPAS